MANEETTRVTEDLQVVVPTGETADVPWWQQLKQPALRVAPGDNDLRVVVTESKSDWLVGV